MKFGCNECRARAHADNWWPLSRVSRLKRRAVRRESGKGIDGEGESYPPETPPLLRLTVSPELWQSISLTVRVSTPGYLGRKLEGLGTGWRCTAPSIFPPSMFLSRRRNRALLSQSGARARDMCRHLTPWERVACNNGVLLYSLSDRAVLKRDNDVKRRYFIQAIVEHQNVGFF